MLMQSLQQNIWGSPWKTWLMAVFHFWIYQKYTLIIHIFPFRLKLCDPEMENLSYQCSQYD